MNTFSELRAKVGRAHKEYTQALKAQMESIKFRTGIPDPDGTQLLHHTNQRLRVAFIHYRQALRTFTDHILHRVQVDQSLDNRSTTPLIAEVLLIEDHRPEVRLIEEIVACGPSTVKITTANDCSGALAHLSGLQLMPNLVIADLGVLEFGGVELMKQCIPRGIPVVVFSGSASPEDRENVLRLGAKEFVEKPTNLGQYTAAVWKIISKWTQQGECKYHDACHTTP
jgi:CheY-like chemotaxis protein